MTPLEADFKFGWAEYTVVAVMLLLSVLIGLYYTFFDKQETFTEYMMGGKNMGVFPVSMSIVASFISGVTLIGLPTEVYLYGTQYAACNFANIIIMVVTGVFFLPIYHTLQLDSIFKYLELRFDSKVRMLGTLMFSLSLILYLPAVVYVPALAFNQVTDVSMYVVTPIICAGCLFYTAFGGLKAVLWTDTLQNMFTFVAVAVVDYLGVSRLGGIGEIWRINRSGHRLELFNMNPDPFARNTFWTVTIGVMFLYLVNFSTNPGSLQRFLAVPSLRKAKWVLVCSSIGFYIIINLCVFMGLILYARYYQCDPVAAGVISNANQMVPMFVMEVGRDYPGLAGLYMSGVLSAALSTLSAFLNTVAGTLYKDVMEVCFPKIEHSEAKQSTIIKGIVLFLGLISMAGVCIVDKLGTIFQMANSILGTVNGSILSLFILGMFVPRANVKGALAGTVASVVLTAWIIIHAQYYIIQGEIRFPGKKTTLDNCPASVTDTYTSNSSLLYTYSGEGTPVEVDSSVSLLYSVSYNYYIVLGALAGLIVGVVVSLLTEPPDLDKLDPQLFSPYVRRLLPHKAAVSPSGGNGVVLEFVETNGKSQ